MNRQSDKLTALYCRIDNPLDIGKDAIIAHIQIDRLSRYAEKHGLKNPMFFCDWGFSGKTSDLPEYQRMLREVETGKIAALVVLNLSHLIRSNIDAWVLIGNIFSQHNVVLHSVNEGGKITDCMTQIQKSIIKLNRQSTEGGQE